MKGGEPRALLPLVVVTALLLPPAPAVAGFTASTSATATFRAADAFGPRNVVAPSLSASPVAGQTMTASPGVWEPANTVVTLAWQIETAGVWATVATGSSFTPRSADAGKRLRVAVTGNGTTVASEPFVVAYPLRPVSLSPPVVSGERRAGATLTADTGDWANSPTTFNRAWLRCAFASATTCPVVAGRTGAEFSLTTTDIGFYLRHRVTAWTLAGSAIATSEPVAIAPSPTTVGSIWGRAFTGALITANGTTWTTHPTLPWAPRRSFWRCPGPTEADCTVIAAQGSSTYTPVAADVGKWIRVREYLGQNGIEGEARTIGALGPIHQLPPRLTATVTTNVPNAPATEYIADGSGATVWNAPGPQRAGHLVQLDFGAVKTLVAYDIASQMGGVVEISSDGMTWSAIPRDGNAALVADTVFDPTVTARFLRLRLTYDVASDWWLNDIRVWGS